MFGGTAMTEAEPTSSVTFGPQEPNKPNFVPLLCAGCFSDDGLRLMAEACAETKGTCPNCKSEYTLLLDRMQLISLSYDFFVKGSIFMAEFGGAPAIQFNDLQKGSLNPDLKLASDVKLLEKILEIGFFHYGPRMWMLGDIEPLEALRNKALRASVIERVIKEYPTVTFLPSERFYRVRKAPLEPSHAREYDAPPKEFLGSGRLDSTDHPVLYASQDIQICVHESRFAAGDELYIATLQATRPLRLLDLTAVLYENLTEFESLDLAVHMLFLARSHAYEISRAISIAAKSNSFDGLIYPSYYSLLRTGGAPFETTLGISLRRLASAAAYEKSKIIANLALFGYPILSGYVKVSSINRLAITAVSYQLGFGPAKY